MKREDKDVVIDSVFDVVTTLNERRNGHREYGVCVECNTEYLAEHAELSGARCVPCYVEKVFGVVLPEMPVIVPRHPAGLRSYEVGANGGRHFVGKDA